MTRLLLPGAVLLAVLAAGCDCNDPQPCKVVEESPIDCILADAVRTTQVDNAIITQHTLYAYHFVTNGAALNDLGQRDLKVLADHFRQNPGQLNIRRGDASPELHKARAACVVAFLTSAGVKADSIRISDQLPGGDGRNSESVLKILREPQLAPGNPYVPPAQDLSSPATVPQ